MVNLTCVINHRSGVAPNVTWFLNDIPMVQTGANGFQNGVFVETEKFPISTVSKLVIWSASPKNEGKYTCGGTIVYPDSVVLRLTRKIRIFAKKTGEIYSFCMKM